MARWIELGKKVDMFLLLLVSIYNSSRLKGISINVKASFLDVSTLPSEVSRGVF
jgi:hypothetical protein